MVQSVASENRSEDVEELFFGSALTDKKSRDCVARYTVMQSLLIMVGR